MKKFFDDEISFLFLLLGFQKARLNTNLSVRIYRLFFMEVQGKECLNGVGEVTRLV
jgi:hypothetical protein